MSTRPVHVARRTFKPCTALTISHSLAEGRFSSEEGVLYRQRQRQRTAARQSFMCRTQRSEGQRRYSSSGSSESLVRWLTKFEYMDGPFSEADERCGWHTADATVSNYSTRARVLRTLPAAAIEERARGRLPRKLGQNNNCWPAGQNNCLLTTRMRAPEKDGQAGASARAPSNKRVKQSRQEGQTENSLPGPGRPPERLSCW